MIPLYVIDQFYDRPEDVRQFALHCRYKLSKDAWPGLQSLEMWPETEHSLMRMARMVSNTMPDWSAIYAAYKFWGEAPCGGFQALMNDRAEPGTIHLHRRGQWTGIVYLSLPQDCEGKTGTQMFRHRHTKASSLLSIDAAVYDDIKRDRDDHSQWECIGGADMVFNRLVLFDSRYFHTWSPGFGTSIENCRLVHIYNFSTDF